MQTGEASQDSSQGQSQSSGNQDPGGTRSFAKITVRVLVGFTFIAIIFIIGGFLRFADIVSGMVPPENPKADAIVVLTGGSQRLVQGVDLLQSGAASRLLISGVHPTTSAQQIRKMTRGSEDLFKCCVDIGHKALDTIGNAYESVDWIRLHGFKHVLIVTNNYHMPRSLYELRDLDPHTEFIAYPVVHSDLKDRNWLTNGQVLRMMIGEYLKLSFAVVRNTVGLSTPYELGSSHNPK